MTKDLIINIDAAGRKGEIIASRHPREVYLDMSLILLRDGMPGAAAYLTPEQATDLGEFLLAAAGRITADSDEIAAQQRMERAIVEKAVDGLLAAGYAVAVDNGGDEHEVPATKDRAAILDGLFACDEETLVVFQGGKRIGTVDLVYGNDGWDVICDYSTSLEEALTEANRLAEALSEEA